MAACLLATAQAQAAPAKIAVLEFHNYVKLTGQETAYVTDLVRRQALSLGTQQYFVMTKENILQMLPPGTTLASCQGECEVETGRKVGADYVVSGEILRFGRRKLKVSMKLHETRSGRLLAQESASGGKVDLLEGPVKEAASRMFEQLPVASPEFSEGAIVAPRGTSGGSSREEVVVEFASEPTGAVVRLDGAILCQETPCRREVVVGPHDVVMERERYEPARQRLEAARGANVRMTLKPTFGWLSVVTEPAGVDVAIDGKPAGKSPLARREIDPGGHEVLVVDPCYARGGERLAIRQGEDRTVKIAAQMRTAEVKVRARDERGDALEAEVRIDGQRVGLTPSTFRVPLCSRTVEVVLSGHKWTRSLDLKEGQAQELDATVEGPRLSPPVELSPAGSGGGQGATDAQLRTPPEEQATAHAPRWPLWAGLAALAVGAAADFVLSRDGKDNNADYAPVALYAVGGSLVLTWVAW